MFAHSVAVHTDACHTILFFLLKAYLLHMVSEAQDLAAFPILGKPESRVVSGLREIGQGATQTPVWVLCYIAQLPVVLHKVCCYLISCLV